MKDIKTILNESKENATFSLNIDELLNLLFALAYTYKWDDELNKWERGTYESLYINLYKVGEKAFGNEFKEINEPNIEKVQTRA